MELLIEVFRELQCARRAHSAPGMQPAGRLKSNRGLAPPYSKKTRPQWPWEHSTEFLSSYTANKLPGRVGPPVSAPHRHCTAASDGASPAGYSAIAAVIAAVLAIVTAAVASAVVAVAVAAAVATTVAAAKASTGALGFSSTSATSFWATDNAALRAASSVVTVHSCAAAWCRTQ